MLALATPAGAAGTDLLVGSVRDERGLVASGALVTAFDDMGGAAGSDHVAADGTFAIVLRAPARRLVVRCKHCQTKNVAIGSTNNVVVVVRRFLALESDIPSAADLAALPYGRIADDLALVPFVVTAPGDSDVSVQNLAGGHGLIVDDGVPLADFATGSSALIDFPDRYVQSIAIEHPQAAFQYGDYAGGGAFALVPATASSYGAIDEGAASTIALEPLLASLRPAYGESNDDGILSRRADLGTTFGIAGGTVNATIGSASQALSASNDTYGRSDDLVHLAFTTSSQHYNYFAELSGAHDALFDASQGTENYTSSYVSGDVRIERPGPVDLVAGSRIIRQTALALDNGSLSGRTDAQTEYVEATTGGERFGARAGIALSAGGASEALEAGTRSGDRIALVPSLSGTVPLGAAGAYLRLDYSQALRVPTLVEVNAYNGRNSALAPLDRDALEQAAVGFDDDSRVRFEAIAYRENIGGFDNLSQMGLGVSAVWQLAPLVSVRAWTLHATPETYFGGNAESVQTSASRQVGWITYANTNGIRIDAIVHRDAANVTNCALLDADAVFPLAQPLAFTLGTEHTIGVRTYYLGLRSP